MAVIEKPTYYDRINVARELSSKQVLLLDEHSENKELADAMLGSNKG